eukprot:GFUD01028305.1.p1 GENE.GFUD01028305.1~~GFUD01028305.1.p1  ORF type:complete len:538 (+),score=140.55 GFUD01028305.1:90-1703(+)
MPTKEIVNILWFRNGLRLHDNESLLKATKDTSQKLLPLFIFDGETPTTKHCKYNKMAFLLECLEDLDTQFWHLGGKLNMVEGDPVEVLRKISKHFSINKLCFDQDCESIWHERDDAVKNFCRTHGITVEESIGATLWDPLEIIEANGGSPPLTYSQFCQVTDGIGQPRRPVADAQLTDVKFVELESCENLLSELTVFPNIPTPQMLGIEKENGVDKIYRGGEREALKYFYRRIKHERESFLEGAFLPNRLEPDILVNPPKSLSPDIKFGCISVKKFYWAVLDAWDEVNDDHPPGSYKIVSQLIWREFFYAMSANNPFYGEMTRNPICINIPWCENDDYLNLFLGGQTGYPFIDAGIRQLKKEGWVHHIIRNALSMFLTRGDLWLSWEHGLNMFLKYLIDADWSVCAGNWMWVSSSAFEKSLNASVSLDPGVYGSHVDPEGEYIRKYVPELMKFPAKYIYEPWKASAAIQEKADCVIGTDYPMPMVVHQEASVRNRKMMEELQEIHRNSGLEEPSHIKPSDELEIKNFFGLPVNFKML